MTESDSPSNNKTPTKSVPNESSYSPITILKSPAQNLNQGNLTGLPRVARDIAADVFNNIQKWNKQHIDGAGIVKQIALLKSESTEKFPPNLEDLVQELHNVMKNLLVYSNALVFLSSQMQSLTKLHKHSDLLFISLSVEQLSMLVRNVSDAYKAEFKAKEYVLENIAFANTKAEVMFFAASWAHQINITDAIKLKLETLLTETGHRSLG